MRIAKAACPVCGGDVYLDYKRGRYGANWRLEKCLSCHRVFSAGTVKNKAEILPSNPPN